MANAKPQHIVNMPSMDWSSGDDKIAISHYKERMQRCFRVNDIPKEKQTDIIIYQLGEIGEKKVKSWGLSEEQLADPANVWTKLEATCGIDHSFRAARIEFANMTQGSQQTVDMFYADLKEQCDKCRFKQPEERMIDQIIRGIKNTEAKKELVVENEALALETCLKIARKHESQKKHESMHYNHLVTPRILTQYRLTERREYTTIVTFVAKITLEGGAQHMVSPARNVGRSTIGQASVKEQVSF